jgi:hypothetical protein
MQSHLGLCLPLPCDFTLESFTRGLASQDANKHAQRLVAAIAPTALSSSASNPPLCVISRPDHNATAPCAKSTPAFAPSTSAISIGGHHAVAQVSADRRLGQARQPVRDGATRSGLTRPRTAGQFRIVMAALLSDGDAQRQNELDERDAQGWETVRR